MKHPNVFRVDLVCSTQANNKSGLPVRSEIRARAPAGQFPLPMMTERAIGYLCSFCSVVFVFKDAFPVRPHYCLPKGISFVG